MKKIFIDQDGNAFEYEDGKPNTEPSQTIKSGRNTVHLNGGNYTQEIKGNYIQGSVVGSSSTPKPERKDLSKDGDAIDVKSEEA
ncbi:hypothetical protein QUA56_33600 [Microcoleus sp. N3A4]|uniref:hypothetical protein n=1 Tax=Microcoleus sp. N3A4 TaxID=3055379 RepID=UPI002FCFF1E9